MKALYGIKASKKCAKKRADAGESSIAQSRLFTFSIYDFQLEQQFRDRGPGIYSAGVLYCLLTRKRPRRSISTLQFATDEFILDYDDCCYKI